eukprot:SAG11_NODE_843_length_6892_cov_31.379803_3_plen_827_part_00
MFHAALQAFGIRRSCLQRRTNDLCALLSHVCATNARHAILENFLFSLTTLRSLLQAWAKVARANACALELPPASHNDVWQAASEGREPTRQRTGKRRRATTWMVEEVGRWVARRAEFIVLAHGSVDCCFGPVAPSAQDASLSQEYFHCIDMDGSGTLGISELKAILDSGTATDTPRGDPPGDATNRAQLLASQKQTHDVLRTVATEKRAAAEVGAAELLATFSAAKYEVRQLAQCEVQHQAALSLRSPHREPQPQPQLQPQPHATQHEPESDTADRPQSPDAFRDMCSALFKQIDIDGNGVLTKKEMKKGMDAIKSGFGLSLKAKDVLKAADMDGDQLIDAKEFYQFMRGVLPDMSTGVDQRAANTECESVRFSAVGDHVADAAVVLGGATAPSGAEAAAKDISSKAVLAKTGATAEHEEVLNNAQAVAHEKQLHASNESLVAQVARLKAHECAAAEEETESQNVRLGAEPEPEPRSTAGAQQPASTWASRKKASIEAQQRQSTQPPSDAFRDMCDALFDSIDIDGDGELTLQEIKKGLGMMRGFGVNMKANAFFKAADVDGSKSVDREEFHTFMRAQLYPTKPKLNPKLNPIPNPDPNLPTFEVVEVEDDRAHALHAFAKHASPDAHGGDSAAIGVKDCTPSRAAEAAEAVEAAAPARDGFRKQCNTLFREIDTNGDGLLTKKEIKKGIDAINSSTGLSLKAKAIFKAADTDGSKELDADEFHAFMRSAMPDKAATAETAAEVASQQPPRDAAYREMCDALFDSVDIDADGMLTLKEIKSGLGLINSVSPRLYLKAKAIFEAAGVDGSKLVDKDQFYNFMKGGQD